MYREGLAHAMSLLHASPRSASINRAEYVIDGDPVPTGSSPFFVISDVTGDQSVSSNDQYRAVSDPMFAESLSRST